MQRAFARQLTGLVLIFLSSSWTVAQTLRPRPQNDSPERNVPGVGPEAAPVVMPMSVPAGIPIKIAVTSEIRIRKVGQRIQGRTVEPIYAFDKLVIPAGTMVNGKIAAIDPVPMKTRVMDATDGNFSPLRHYQVEFDELVMADGRDLQLQTVASPAPDGVLRFVAADAKKKENRVKQAASDKVSGARQQVRQDWEAWQKQIHEPGKMHKVKRFLLGELPVRPQYIEPGTAFNAELRKPLEFGTESLPVDALTDVGSPPPEGSVVRARLLTRLSSATAKKGDAVEALITQPLIVSNRLILPEGSKIEGSVVQVQPARRLGRNGRLRILFHEVAPPNGLEQRVETSLQGVAVAGGEHLRLDKEGGAEVTTPKTRYLTTGIAVMLAASQASPDRDAGQGNASVGEAGGAAANGASGFHLVGMIATLAAGSRVISAGFGSYGAAMSIYNHFLSRGRDVVYPKDMAMVVGLGSRNTKTASPRQ
jgi:hypothetical protein